MDVQVKNLTKQFGKTTAVNQLNVVFKDGKLTGLLGPSGCGKSTTLYMIAGLESATDGQILFGDRDVTTLMPEKRNIGLVFQNYALYPHMTVRDNIVFPLSNMKDPETGKKYTRAKRDAAADEIAKLVQIESLMDRKPGQLSGGQHSSKHAIVLKGQGIEFLIHVGLDTNQLNGDGFKIFVDPDQVVKQGDILLTFDSEILKKHRCIDATPFVFTNLNRKNITVNRYGMVNLNEPFIIVERG